MMESGSWSTGQRYTNTRTKLLLGWRWCFCHDGAHASGLLVGGEEQSEPHLEEVHRSSADVLLL